MANLNRYTHWTLEKSFVIVGICQIARIESSRIEDISANIRRSFIEETKAYAHFHMKLKHDDNQKLKRLSDLCDKFTANPWWYNDFAIDKGASNANLIEEDLWSFRVEISTRFLDYYYREYMESVRQHGAR